MKKLAVLASCLALSSCFSAGNHDILGFRNTFIEYFNTYSISFYDTENVLVSSEYVEENNFKHNVILTAYTGYTVVDTKVYRKDIYRSEYLTVNVDGVLNCGSVPVAYRKGERVKAVGETTIDGEDFALVETKLKGFVALVRPDGSFYNRIGQIRNGRLALLETDFRPFPLDFKMVQITTSKSEQTEPVRGFDIKYEGLNLGRLKFTMLDYSQGDSGYFKNVSYPYEQGGILDLNGVGIKVVQATSEKLDYIILK